MASQIKTELKNLSHQPQLYELGLGIFIICFILTSLLFWQYTHPAISQPLYYTLEDSGQITPVTATIDRSEFTHTEVLGETLQRDEAGWASGM